MDLANANDPKLHTLVGACERASFGLDKKDILDETYRKAWKMDSSRFSTSFDIVNTGILDHVYAKLTPGSPDMIRPELYKLNAYGEILRNPNRIQDLHSHLQVLDRSSKHTRTLLAVKRCSVHLLLFSLSLMKAAPCSSVTGETSGPSILQL